ncbi:hypothetical protein V866_005405 [Kwoniella sp. B9012]
MLYSETIGLRYYLYTHNHPHRIYQWRNGSLPHGKLPSDDDFSLVCEHGGRSIVPNYKRKAMFSIITAEALAILKSIIGDIEVIQEVQTECKECLSMVDGSVRYSNLQTEIGRKQGR